MQKIYLLLRDNKQTGPHSLEELQLLNLKATDLVWVEGRSMGWAFPSEIETLKHFVPVSDTRSEPLKTSLDKNNISPKVYVSYPSKAEQFNFQSPEDRATELKARAMEQQNAISNPIDLKKNYDRSLEDVESDYTNWVIKNHKKKKSFSRKKIAIASIIIIGSLAGWWLANLAYNKPLAIASVNQHPTSENNNELLQEKPISNQMPSEPSGEVLIKKPISKKSKPGISTTKQKDIIAPPVETPIKESPIKKTVEQAPEAIATETEKKETEQKKKSLKEKFNDWLKGGKELGKKQTSSGMVLADISDKVDVRINKDHSNWMMGVRGEKLVITNNSAYMLHSALIELSYFTEEDVLLEKRKIDLAELAKGGSKTIAIPDHKMADHVEAKVVEARGLVEEF